MEQQALGKHIREERLKLNLTQEKLAEDVNLSTAYIGQIERGERSLTLENLAAVANRLGVTIDYLLSDSIIPDSDGQYQLWCQLMNGRTEGQKALAINKVSILWDIVCKFQILFKLIGWNNFKHRQIPRLTLRQMIRNACNCRGSFSFLHIHPIQLLFLHLA